MFCSCERKDISGISVGDILLGLERAAGFSASVKEDIRSKETAERYGIITKNIKEGIVSCDPGGGKIIVIIAKNDKSVLKIEKALSAEKLRLIDAFENNSAQTENARNIIIKTKGRYCLFIFSDNPRNAEATFDSIVS